MKYLEMYQTMHKMNKDYGRGGVKCIASISALVDFLKPETILDYGCGKGELVRALAEKYPRIKVCGYDPAVEEFSAMPVEKADLVVCTDVLEHIPADELPETVSKIAAISQNVFFHLHHAKAIAVLPNGENSHCTIWTPQQYAELFSKYFSVLNFLPGESPKFNTSCLTFNIPEEIKTHWEIWIRGNAINYVDDLETFLKLLYSRQENIIFPAQGWSGTNAVLDYLKYSNHLNRVSGIAAESVANDYEEKFFGGLPVLPIKFLIHFRDSANFFVLLPQQYHVSAQQFFRRLGFRNVIFIGENLISQCQSALQNFMNSGGIMNWFINDVTQKINALELKMAEQIEVCAKNTAAFAEYRNCFRGKKVVIVGTGPTLKYYKPMADAIHIALNRAWQKADIPFDYLFIQDGSQRNAEIKFEDGFDKIKQKIFVGIFPKFHPNNRISFPENTTPAKNIARYYLNVNVPNQPIFQDICYHPLFDFNTVAFSALQFALFTYPKEIYLVGCDTSNGGYFYASDNQFLDVSRVKIGYMRMKMFAMQYYPDTKIISINPVGLKGLFEDIYTEDFFKR